MKVETLGQTEQNQRADANRTGEMRAEKGHSRTKPFPLTAEAQETVAWIQKAE